MILCKHFHVVLILIVFSILPRISTGQLRQDLPGQVYFNAFPEFFAADYQKALRLFVRGGNGALKIGNSERFLDSVCYWTMAGECLFHLGQYGEALNYYEQSLALAGQYANGSWQSRLQRPSQVVQQNTSAVRRAGVTWHRTQRGGDNVSLVSRYAMLFGRLDAARAIVEGGVLQAPEVRTVDHGEIMRCIALAIYRRYSIRGVTSHIDPGTAQIVANMSRLPTQSPVLGKWNLIVRGLAKMSIGRNDQAIQDLQAGLKLDNQLDHKLTPIALLALAKIAFIDGNSVLANELALEASYSAAVFQQFDFIEDALAFGSQVHLTQSKSVYPPLPAAVQWASGNRRARLAQTSLLLRVADGQLEANDSAAAEATLTQARRSMSRTDLPRSRLAGQFSFFDAAVAFAQNRDGSADLRNAIAQLHESSLWLFRLETVNRSLAAGTITQRQAELIYDNLLVDPSSNHWRTDPMETLAYATSQHVEAMENWFGLLLARKNHDKAIEISERIRRHRFYQSLPLAGRLLSIRWMATAPDDLLTRNSNAQRQAFFNRYPQFAQSVSQINAIEEQLAQIPLKPDDDSDEQRRQRDLYAELLRISEYQESAIRAVSLSRQAADFVFPAPIDYSGISNELKPHQVLIASLETPSGYHQYAITQNSRRYLGVVRSRDVYRLVGKLLKSLGLTDLNGAIDTSVFTGDDWKMAAADLKQKLFKDYHDDQWSNYQELIIVPDGLLWYVPWEILQTGDAPEKWANLNEKIKMRYLPMISMVTNSKREPRKSRRIAVVTGRMHAKGDEQLTRRGFEKLTDTIQNAVSFDRNTKIPSNLTNAVTDTLMVWHDVKADAKVGALGLAPFFLDRGRTGSTLGEWLSAPWAGCENIILPAFSSFAAPGLKTRSNGQDLFLTTCAMLASGSRSVMISRWRPGGENSIDIAREFLIHSNSMSTVEALELSINTAKAKDLNLENEIRVKPNRKLKGSIKADHPFFWAGNMLVDLHGYTPPKQDNADIDVADSGDGNDIPADANDQDPFGQPAAGSDTKTDNPILGATKPPSPPKANAGSKSRESGSDTKTNADQQSGSGSKQ